MTPETPSSKDGSFKPMILPLGSKAERGQQLNYARKAIACYERLDRGMLDKNNFGHRFDRHHRQMIKWQSRMMGLHIKILNRLNAR